LISKTLCISQAFLCPVVIFHKALHLGDNICGRFNAVSINICYKDMQKHKITECFAESSCKCAEKSNVSQQWHNVAHSSH